MSPLAIVRNVDALHRFEQLVLSQKPASKPWEPVTDYSWEARKEIEGPHADRILETFGKHASDGILDYGAGFGHLVRCLNERGGHATGYEPALAMQPESGENLAKFRTAWGKGDWGLVICREVVEHCTVLEIRTLVSDLCWSAKGFVYLTTRFAKHPDHLLDVDTSDDLDPTHITMLNQDFLRVLFVLEGFRRRADLETRMDWMQKGRVLVYERAA